VGQKGGGGLHLGCNSVRLERFFGLRWLVCLGITGGVPECFCSF
jgi:hypothetical protein